MGSSLLQTWCRIGFGRARLVTASSLPGAKALSIWYKLFPNISLPEQSNQIILCKSGLL